MLLPAVLVLLEVLQIVGGMLVTVLPSREVWEGDMVTMECRTEGVEGVIWVRERFNEGDVLVEKELIAHDEHILLDDTRLQVEKEIIDDSTCSTLKARI